MTKLVNSTYTYIELNHLKIYWDIIAVDKNTPVLDNSYTNSTACPKSYALKIFKTKYKIQILRRVPQTQTKGPYDLKPTKR